MRWFQSLLTRYVLIIFLAIIILPFSFPLTSLLMLPLREGVSTSYQSGSTLEKNVKKTAKELDGADIADVDQQVKNIQASFKKADIFWVDAEGRTRQNAYQNDIPEIWSAGYTVEFMKKNRGSDADPYTLVTMLGKTNKQGFIVTQVPRNLMKTNDELLYQKYNLLWIIGIFIILCGFIFISFIFFYRIRKRLLRVQNAMTIPTENGIPSPLVIEKRDEIGQLEESFNNMIGKLEVSREREKEEEELRRQLIANLSHDLRTPLTTIRGHAFRLKREPLTNQGHSSLASIDAKVDYLGQLIENLMSYTLLSSGKYPFHPERIDAARIVRSSSAAWYPVFEKEGFIIELDIIDTPIFWTIDPQWFERVLDNVFQNVNRHAVSGKYIGITFNHLGLSVSDHGKGMDGQSAAKGAGIGLSIVTMMLKTMKLGLTIKSGESGTMITIQPPH
ncbi:HAMP domain-containing sensor histidine kinase [Peribacillus sp. FSL H8-0477]|uniref:HAMP domain-containing sensor histidine kinase n=1 Tax=Peribacillus sp. FSL H8-0477 TaxID=2921388 RepID=UPI0030FB4950